MAKYFTVIFLVCYGNFIFGQSLSADIVASTGRTFSADNVQLSFTIGETAVSTINVNSSVISQGFHQTYLKTTALSPNLWDLNVKAYPNPTESFHRIQFQLEEVDEINYKLYTTSGQLLSSENIIAQYFDIKLDLITLSSDTYILTISRINTKQKSSWKIEKFGYVLFKVCIKT